MRGLMAVELDKSLRNPWLICSVAIGAALSLFAVRSYLAVNVSWQQGVSADEWYGLGAQNAFAAWMPADGTFESTVFFFVAPLLAVLPYAWSMRTELSSGAISHQLLRARRSEVHAARYAAVFVSSGLAVAVPLLVNLVALLCVLPARVPEAAAGIYIGVGREEMLASLLFGAPSLFVVAKTLLDFLIAGLWGGFVLGLSVLIENRVLLLAGSFLLSVATGFAAAHVPARMGVNAHAGGRR